MCSQAGLDSLLRWCKEREAGSDALLLQGKSPARRRSAQPSQGGSTRHIAAYYRSHMMCYLLTLISTSASCLTSSCAPGPGRENSKELSPWIAS